MRALATLTEELEARPGDADRVDALARHLRAVGRHTGALAGEWLVAATATRTKRPVRLTLAKLADAARALAADAGTAPWLFDAGRAGSDEAAEAIALLLPWPQGEPDATSRPTLVDWMAAWASAAAQPPATRALAVAAVVASLDDPMTRRWAVRAVCGLVKPTVDEWHWQRAWARAFDDDAHAVAWWWHHEPHALRHATPTLAVPRPRDFASFVDAPADRHADLLAAWRRGELHAEPRWRGVRVHVVRRGDQVAVWQRGGRLLNARLPAAWLVAAAWPELGAIEAVLLAWQAGRGAALEEAWASGKTPDDRPSLHLALVDWHGGAHAPAERRAQLLARWPALDLGERDRLPAIFASPRLSAPPEGDLAAHADASRRDGWSGVVLRHRDTADAWAVRARLHRVRAVLQYVPKEALGATQASARALAFVDCGFALWNRAPRSDDERRAAMTAAMSGQFLPPPDDAPAIDGLRLLPLARLTIELPDAELLRLHAWLRDNAGLRFGGVHAVAPALVFELGFAEVRASARHRLGATLVGARVLRWVHDAPPGDAQRSEDLFPAR